jgi:hypothetical protein
VGKGDKRRPTVVTDEEHQTRWDKAFKKSEEEKDEQAQQPRSE